MVLHSTFRHSPEASTYFSRPSSKHHRCFSPRKNNCVPANAGATFQTYQRNQIAYLKGRKILRNVRRVAKLLPFYEFTGDQYFSADGAPADIASQRKDAFFALAKLYAELVAGSGGIAALGFGLLLLVVDEESECTDGGEHTDDHKNDHRLDEDCRSLLQGRPRSFLV